MEGIKGIFVPITAGVESYRAELAQAASITQQTGAQVAAAAAAVSSANEKAANTTRTLQQEYRAAAKEAQKLAQLHGMNHAATLEATQRAAEYKDQLDDVNDRINAFHPEKKWQLAADGVAAAIDVARAGVGVMQALGLNTEDAAKAIQVMMTMQAAADALRSLEALKGAYQAISVMIKTNVIPAITTMNGMLMAGGIVALVAIVAALAYNWYQTSKAEEEAAKNAEEYKKKLEEIEKQRQKSIANIQQTQALETRAMRDGLQKQLQTLTDAKNKEIEETAKALRTNEITVQMYNDRIKAIDAYYHNERLASIKDFNEKAAKERQEAAAKEQAELQKVYANRRKWMDSVEADFVRQNAEAAEAAANELARVSKESMESMPEMPLPAPPNLEEHFKRMRWREALENLNAEVTTVLSNGVANFATGFAAAVGAAFMSSADGIKDVGSFVLNALGQLAQQIGALMIAYGVAQFKFNASVGTLNPIGMVAAGAALVAIGAAISARSKKGMTNSSGGGGSMPSSSSGGDSSGWTGTAFGAAFGMSGQPVLTSRVSGRDIELVTGRQGIYSRRLTGR